MPVATLFRRVSSATRFEHLLGRVLGLSALTLAGQFAFLAALPILSRIYTPADLGVFAVYLSIVNIFGAVVSLKFEASLFSLESKQQDLVCLKLSLVCVIVLSAVTYGLLSVVTARFGGDLERTVQSLAHMLPFGIGLAGLWGLTTALALKKNAIRPLAYARFAQPVSMAVLQLGFGAIHLPATALAVAHLLSHVLYAGYLFAMCLEPADLRRLWRVRAREMAARARADFKFPLYVLPAYVLNILLGNAPVILLGGLYGASIAGSYGVASRIVTGPVTVVCMPLGNIFTAEAILAQSDTERLAQACKFTFVFSLTCVCGPLLIFAAFAPRLISAVLGSGWQDTGEIVSCLAAMAAAQSLASPFSDVYSIFHHQKVRLVLECVQSLLFFTPFVIAKSMHMPPLTCIRLMAIGGCIGFIIALLVSTSLVTRQVRQVNR